MDSNKKDKMGFIESEKLRLMNGWQRIEMQKKEISKNGSFKMKIDAFFKYPLLKIHYIFLTMELIRLDALYRFEEGLTAKRYFGQHFKILKSIKSSTPLFETFSDLLKRGELFEGEDYDLNECISYYIKKNQGL